MKRVYPRFAYVLLFCCFSIVSLLYCILLPLSPHQGSKHRPKRPHSELLVDDRSHDQGYFFPPSGDYKGFILSITLTICPPIEPDEGRELAPDQPLLVIIVSSAIGNFAARRAIRETWGQWARNSSQKLYFLVGRQHPGAEEGEGGGKVFESLSGTSLSNGSVEDVIKQESVLFEDIIQFDFVDNYYNLTTKSLLMLRFFNEKILRLNYDDLIRNGTSYAFDDNAIGSIDSRNDSEEALLLYPTQHAFLFKTDDDMFIHVANLLNLLKRFVKYYNQVKDQKRSTTVPFRLLMGCLIRRASPFRNFRNKYFVPHHIYPGPEFPDYISGTAYLMSSETATSLLITALFTRRCPYFYLEDIYLTGICAAKAVNLKNGLDWAESRNSTMGIKPLNNAGFRFQRVDPKDNMCYYRSPATITGHHLSPFELRQVWAAMFTREPLSECKKKRRKKGKKKGKA